MSTRENYYRMRGVLRRQAGAATGAQRVDRIIAAIQDRLGSTRRLPADPGERAALTILHRDLVTTDFFRFAESMAAGWRDCPEPRRSDMMKLACRLGRLALQGWPTRRLPGGRHG